MADVSCIYQSRGGQLVPTSAAAGPWSPDLQHGGPPAGLLARAIERWLPDRSLQVARITLDLFRGVPMQPLRTRVTPVREGRRIVALDASLLVSEVEVARAHAVLLRAPGGAGQRFPGHQELRGPGGLQTGELLPESMRDQVPDGFHTCVQVRWLPRGSQSWPAAWFRLPVPLVEGEATTPLQCAMALSDFTNALSAAATWGQGTAGYINADSTLYLAREPRGDWIGLQCTRAINHEGVGFGEVLQFDSEGCYGRAVQARLQTRP